MGHPADGADPIPDGRPNRSRLRADLPGRLLGVRPIQLMVWQAAVLVAVATWPGPSWARVAGLVLLATTTVLLLARWRGTWLFVWLGVRARYRRRARTHHAAGMATPGGHTPGAAGTGESVESVEDRAGVRYGLIAVDDGWVSVLAVEPVPTGAVTVGGPAQSIHRDQQGMLPLQALADVFADRDIRLASAQLVTSTVPAPSPHVDPRSPLAVSYQELCGGSPVDSAIGPVVAHRSAWVALRLNPQQCRSAIEARGGGVDGAHRALISVTARLAASLQEGARVRPLSADEVRAVLAATAGPDPSSVQEHWRHVTAGARVEVCFTVASWGSADPTELLTALTTVPTLSTTTSLALSPAMGSTSSAARGGVGCRVTIRFVTLAEDQARTERAIIEVARQIGVALRRLDGEHAIGRDDVRPLGGVR
ncbi:MAG: type VII secretion protein EccE [Angustibacter sp.]